MLVAMWIGNIFTTVVQTDDRVEDENRYGVKQQLEGPKTVCQLKQLQKWSESEM